MESTLSTSSPSGRSAGNSHSLIVSLPWYDLPPTANALDNFYGDLRTRLLVARPQNLALPEILERTLSPNEQWQNPDLLLSQCCGGDLFTRDGGALTPIARPVFTHLDCEPGYYFSHIVASKKSSNNPRIAINDTSSYSGCIGLFNWLKAAGMRARKVVVSGSHQASLILLQRGEVDLIAIDANTWKLLDLGTKGIIDATKPAPSPPFVCHQRNTSHARVLLHSLSSSLHEFGFVTGFSSLIKSTHADYHMMAEEMGVSNTAPT